MRLRWLLTGSLCAYLVAGLAVWGSVRWVRGLGWA
jgi:hypothetical protein